MAILFAIIEAVTLGLSTIWFALGALLGMLCAVLGLNELVQFIVFLVSSIALVWYTRPIAKKYLKIGVQKTNAEGLVGREALVIQRIEKFKTGQVKINGQYWTAVSYNQNSIESESTVVIRGIEGVKLIVEEIISNKRNDAASFDDINSTNEDSLNQSHITIQTPDTTQMSDTISSSEQIRQQEID